MLFSSKFDPLFRRRLAARAVDSLLCYAAGFPLGTASYIAVFNYNEAAGRVSTETGASILWVFCTVIALALVHIAYETSFLALFSATPGKFLAKLRVADAQSAGKITPKQAYRRAAAVLSGGLYWYFVYPAFTPFAALWAAKRPYQPWDAKAGTKVIDAKAKAAAADASYENQK